jgi:branched-subunit amino acid aminotransferase/4-amino-4-deoxychorismate lyase
MTQPQAYSNGRYLPASEASVSMADGGFVQGTTVAEQLRTFGGRLFRLEAHLDRLFHSLEIVHVDPGLTRDEFIQIARKIAAHNHALLAAGDDLGLVIFVTPGPYVTMVRSSPEAPTVGMHTFPLRFDLWVEKYASGQSLATTDVGQVPADCWPSELKCRSRMHYYLADRQAHARHPGSRALMLDRQGYVTETTTSNVVIYDPQAGLVTPPRRKILPGISLAALAELAGNLGVPMVERDFTPDDLAAAGEVFLTGTSACTLPVVRLNGRPIGGGRPGPMFARLMSAWNDLVALDVIGQARKFATR